MGEDGFSEGFVFGQTGLVECSPVQLDEAPTLRFGDLQPPMDVDQVREPEFLAKAVGGAERLGGAPGQVVDVLWLACAEQRLEEWISEHARVEDSLEAVQRLAAASVLVKRWHVPTLPLPVRT